MKLNEKQSIDAKQGESLYYVDIQKDTMQLISNPFEPVIVRKEPVNPADPPEPPKIKFVQAYIINYLRAGDGWYFIEDMDKEFEIDIAAEDQDPFERFYEVRIEFEPESAIIKKAILQKKPIDGEPNYRGPDVNTFTENIANSQNDDDCTLLFIPICKLLDDTITHLYLRENIHWWGNLIGSGCSMWGASLVNEAQEGNPPIYKLYMGQGTVNNILTPKDTTGTPISEQSLSTVQHLVLGVDININGSLENASVSLKQDADLPTLKLDPLAEDEVPEHIDILVGSFYNGEVCSIYTGPIKIKPYVWFTESKDAAEYKYGEAPYKNIWKIEILS